MQNLIWILGVFLVTAGVSANSGLKSSHLDKVNPNGLKFNLAQTTIAGVGSNFSNDISLRKNSRQIGRSNLTHLEHFSPHTNLQLSRIVVEANQILESARGANLYVKVDFSKINEIADGMMDKEFKDAREKVKNDHIDKKYKAFSDLWNNKLKHKASKQAALRKFIYHYKNKTLSEMYRYSNLTTFGDLYSKYTDLGYVTYDEFNVHLDLFVMFLDASKSGSQITFKEKPIEEVRASIGRLFEINSSVAGSSLNAFNKKGYFEKKLVEKLKLMNGADIVSIIGQISLEPKVVNSKLDKDIPDESNKSGDVQNTKVNNDLE